VEVEVEVPFTWWILSDVRGGPGFTRYKPRAESPCF